MTSIMSRPSRSRSDVATIPQWVSWRMRRSGRKLMKTVRRTFRLRPVVEAVACPGVTLSVHRSSSDVVTQSLVQHGTWEPVETELMQRLLKPGMTMVDVGANLGYMTVVGSRQVGPTGRVIAFEPEPRNFALLKRNVRRNRCDNVEIHPQATGAKTDETLIMFLATENFGDHRTFPDPDEPGRLRHTVRSTTVDSVVAERPVDFVKMDIQGGEGHALTGMQETVRRNADLTILLEFWPYGLRRAGTAPKDLLDRLIDAGFAFRSLATTFDGPPREAQLSVPIDPEEILAQLAGDPFDRYLNLLAVRGSRATERY